MHSAAKGVYYCNINCNCGCPRASIEYTGVQPVLNNSLGNHAVLLDRKVELINKDLVHIIHVLIISFDNGYRRPTTDFHADIAIDSSGASIK